MSTKFTDYDTWTYGGDRLCPPCVWAYTTTALRRQVYIVDATPSPALTVTSRAVLREALHTELPATRAVIVPTRGRKHVLPRADWGHVATDDIALRWDDAATRLHTTLCALRARPAVTATALAAPAPPITVLRATPTDEIAELWGQWSALDPWRGHPWWDTAVALSTPPTPAVAATRAGTASSR